jgi:ADP-ribosylglycohydrolase
MKVLINTAKADAYGAGFEYVSGELVRQHNSLTAYFKHPKHPLAAGMYTDDTQMSLAIAELIVSGAAWSKDNLAEAFVSVFKRDPREGYAGGFYQFLLSVNNGQEFLARIKPDSDKSGAAMRAVVIGIYPTIAEVKQKSALQASVTHDTADGINAAVAAALAGHYFLYRLGPKAELGRFLELHVAGDWSKPWTGKVGEKGWMSVRAAVTAIMSASSMSALLRACVDFTGDVDTVAAIALGAASASDEIAQDLPEFLHEMLENGLFGRDYLLALDAKLAERFASLGVPPQTGAESTS